MTDKTGGHQALRRATALAIAVTVAVLAAACSGGNARSSDGSSGLADCLTAARCYSPSQLRVAYGIQPLLDDGIDGHPGSARVRP